MGRRPKLTQQQQTEARKRRAEGATLKVLARSYNVAAATIFEAERVDARDKHGGPSCSPPRSLLLSVIPMSGEFVTTLDFAGPDYCVSGGSL